MSRELFDVTITISHLQLNEILCVLVRYKFHRFDKAFKAMDRKMTGRFHRGQFNDLLQQ